MKMLIWGAGAIGGALGAYLARAGHDITLVDRAADHVAAIRKGGLHITGPVADFTARMPAYTPAEIGGQYETITLATKAQDTENACLELAPLLAPDGYVVSAQNGLNPIVIARVVGLQRTVGALINFGADYMEPGVIHLGGRGAIEVGEMDGSRTTRVETLLAAFRDFDPDACLATNIWGYLWSKEAYGSMLFATALTNDSIVDCLSDARYRHLYSELAREVLAVARLQGVTPESFNGFDPAAYAPGADPALAVRSLAALVEFNRHSAKTHSGIWRDLAVRKRRTEVDAQLGMIADLGDAAGVPVPMTRRLIDLIHDVENGVRSQSHATLALLSEGLHE